MEGLVSIVIPCYNGEKFIRETLDSVFVQTYNQYEIILVDDGSTDNSAAVVKDIFKEKAACRYIYQQNKGVSSARNKGLKDAGGEFILFLDADDILEKTFLADRVAFLSAQPAYGLCGTAMLRIDTNSKLIEGGSPMQAPDENMVEQILLYQQPYESVPSNLLIRKKIMIDNQLVFEERLSSTADKFFLCGIGKIAKCKNITGGRLLYRIAANSMSHSISKKLLLDNATYFALLKQTGCIPAGILRIVASKNYYMLAGLAYRLKEYPRFFNYFLKYGLVKAGLKKS